MKKTHPFAGVRRATSALTLTCLVASLFGPPAWSFDRGPRGRSARAVRTPVAAVAAVRLAPEERRQRVLDGFARGGHVRRCWTRQLLRYPTTTSRTLSARLRVGEDGRVTAVEVRDPMAPELAACIAAGAASIPPVGPGDAFEAVTTISLERGE